jgi:NitT/TauT family transport system ATP-binding protein
LNSHQFDLASAGSAEFQAATQRIHGLLFGDAAAVAPAQAGAHAEHALRRSMDSGLRRNDGV